MNSLPDNQSNDRNAGSEDLSSEQTLSGKTVILAGGSGGLGTATATLLARQGVRLVIGYRSNRERAQALQNKLEQSGGKVELVEGDLNRKEVCDDLVRRATAGALAGAAVFVGDPARPSSGITAADEAERIERSWNMNFTGPYQLARRAAEAMAAQGVAGSLVLVASMQAVAAFANSTAYAAPKAALVQAARVLAYEFGGPKNISVNVVAPGVTTAGMAAASVASGKYERFIQAGVIPRYGRAEDVARVVRLLLEPDSYITGQVITVDGGLTLRR